MTAAADVIATSRLPKFASTSLNQAAELHFCVICKFDSVLAEMTQLHFGRHIAEVADDN